MEARKTKENDRKEKEKSLFMALTIFCSILIAIIPENLLRTMAPLVVILLPFVLFSFYEELRERLPYKRWIYLQLGLLLAILLLSAAYGFSS